MLRWALLQTSPRGEAVPIGDHVEHMDMSQRGRELSDYGVSGQDGG